MAFHHHAETRTCCIAHNTVRPSNRLAVEFVQAVNMSRNAFVLGDASSFGTCIPYFVAVISRKLISLRTLFNAPSNRSMVLYMGSRCEFATCGSRIRPISAPMKLIYPLLICESWLSHCDRCAILIEPSPAFCRNGCCIEATKPSGSRVRRWPVRLGCGGPFGTLGAIRVGPGVITGAVLAGEAPSLPIRGRLTYGP